MTLVAITGATGFLGSAIVAAFSPNKNVKVRVLSRTHHRARPTSSDMVYGDITEISACEQFVKNANIVIHAAGLLRTNDKIALQRVNVEGTANISRAAYLAGVSRFIYLSSTGVYGAPGIAVDERSPHQPSNPYEKSKSAAEKLVTFEWGESGCVVVQPSNIIGIGHPLKPLCRFLNHIKNNKRVYHVGAWSNYVGVNDVARVVVAASLLNDVPPSIIVNVPLPLDDLADLSAQAVGASANCVKLPEIIGQCLMPATKFASQVMPRLDRLIALMNKTRFMSLHDDWLQRYNIKPKLLPVLCEMAEAYGIGTSV